MTDSIIFIHHCLQQSLVVCVNGSNGDIPHSAELTTVVQVLILQTEKVPHKSPNNIKSEVYQRFIWTVKSNREVHWRDSNSTNSVYTLIYVYMFICSKLLITYNQCDRGLVSYEYPVVNWCSLVVRPCWCFVWSLLTQSVYLQPRQTVSFILGWADKSAHACKANVQALSTVAIYTIGSVQRIQSGPCHWTVTTSFWIAEWCCVWYKHAYAHLGYTINNFITLITG